MLTTKATKSEIKEACNTDLILLLVDLASKQTMPKYFLKTAENVALELERRGIVYAEDLIEDFRHICS